MPGPTIQTIASQVCWSWADLPTIRRNSREKGFQRKQGVRPTPRPAVPLKHTYAEAERLKTERVSERDLRRIKKLNRSAFLRRIRSNEALAGTLATMEVQVGWRYLMEYLERIEEITPDDIQRVANRYVREETRRSSM